MLILKHQVQPSGLCEIAERNETRVVLTWNLNPARRDGNAAFFQCRNAERSYPWFKWDGYTSHVPGLWLCFWEIVGGSLRPSFSSGLFTEVWTPRTWILGILYCASTGKTTFRATSNFLLKISNYRNLKWFRGKDQSGIKSWPFTDLL